MSTGYFQEPGIMGEALVFVSDDDLWRVNVSGGAAVRLSNCRGIPRNPRISPDSKWVAFTGNEEGIPEVYVMPFEGGPVKRLTYIGIPGAKVIGWTPDSENIIFTTQANSAFRSWSIIHRISVHGGQPVNMNLGWGNSLAFGPRDEMVLGRFGRDPAQWKRYRGGRCGEIWIDKNGDRKFKKLLQISSNLVWPMWINDRIYFEGDHHGTGNIYSCNLDGKKLKQHTHHTDFYVRSPQTDGKNIVYQLDGEIHVLNIETDETRKIEITLPSSFKQRQQKMPDLKKHLNSVCIHPKNCSCTVTARGKLFSFPHWDGAVKSYGETNGSIRYRLPCWLNDGERIVAVTDQGGEETLCIFNSLKQDDIQLLPELPLGRPVVMKIVPGKDMVVIINHEKKILAVNLEDNVCTDIDKSDYAGMDDFDVSGDGRWLAYPCSIDPHRVAIMIFDLDNQCRYQVTEPILFDSSPSFDTDGKYLYFLSARVFDPVRDMLDFGYSFPRGIIPMALPLQADLLNPFDPQPASPCDSDDKKPDRTEPADETKNESGKTDSETDNPKNDPVVIDMDRIADRGVAMPVVDARFTDIQAGTGRIWLLESPIRGTVPNRWPPEPYQGAKLDYWDLKTQTREHYASGVYGFTLSQDRKVIGYRTTNGLRILDAAKKPPKDGGMSPGRKTGWVDLNRLTAIVEPPAEWEQMFRETWRLMRDHYFAEDMSGVDWAAMYDRYLPAVKRCSTRNELSEVIWECIGELGTSHSYEMGGDYELPPRYISGKLGADIEYSHQKGTYIIHRIVKGDSWDPRSNSPLNQPGINVQPGHELLAINGRKLSLSNPPGKALMGLSGQKVVLTVSDGEAEWNVTVKTVNYEGSSRLREWINSTTEYVHKKTDGRVGYLYMQDMGTTGFSQFYRAWLAESHREAIIADVRQNAGGHVSSLLLERLTRKRLGYEVARHTKLSPTPPFCVRGPVVALCDEFSGSDGDLFAHKFKALKLGTLIGRRTWGGVVGIAPSHSLVDGTVVTQPEFYHYFDDVGWNLENHGAEPDIEVEMPPQVVARGEDPQLEKAINVIMEQLEKNPVEIPELPLHPRRNTTNK